MIESEKTFCCVAARIWAQLIAGVEIISGNISLLIVIKALYGLVKNEEKLIYLISQGIVKHGLDSETANILARKEVTTIYIYVSIALVLAIIGQIMAIILFIGAHKCKTSFLISWVVYAVIAITWSFIMIRNDKSYEETCVRILLVVFFKCFGIYASVHSIIWINSVRKSAAMEAETAAGIEVGSDGNNFGKENMI